MSTGTTVMKIIKAELIGLLSAQQIHDIAISTQVNLMVAQENNLAANSVISNDDLEGICLVKLQ